MTEHINDECREHSIYPQVIGPVERIIAIGDIHGDFDYLIHLLKIARVIDNNYEWIGGNTHVVQLGDQIDNCRPYYNHCSEKDATPNDRASDIQIINFLDDLHVQASRQGGAVISLLGNHEILNIEGDLSYVSYENIRESHGEKGRRKDFSSTGHIGKKIICTHPPAIIIGTNLFVHAGILPQIIEIIPELRNILKETIKENISQMSQKDVINNMIGRVLNKSLEKRFLHATYPDSNRLWDELFGNKHDGRKIIKKLSNNTNELAKLLKKSDDVREHLKENINLSDIDNMHPIEVINTIVRKWLLSKINRKYLASIDPVNSIFWNRILGSIPNEKHKNIDHDTCDKYVAPVLKFLNVNHMIIGHTPQFMSSQSGINSACDGSLTRVDIGGADVFNLFDSTYEKTGHRMEQRVPQILEILNDKNSRILYDEKYNNMYGGKVNLFKNYYYL